MNPSRDDLTFWQACIVTRGAPGWARRIARPKYAPHVDEHLDRAINTRAGIKRDIGAGSWTGALVLLRMVRSNQARYRHHGAWPIDSTRTLAGYMLDSLACRGTGYDERRPCWRRILARMPREVLAAGIQDVTGRLSP